MTAKDNPPRVALLDPASAAVLINLEQALRRLGDDPPYYEISAEDIGVLADLNPSLVSALNAWTAGMARVRK